MVAKITTPGSIKRALNYNEQKVNLEKAECLYAGNFLQDANELNFYQKVERFEHQNFLNQQAKTNTLHISLNFDPQDKLGTEKLIEIASKYMEKIGFADQPYLVYQHYDAGHTHLHIVTTSIQNDGRRIDTFNIGKNQSEKARKSLELEHNLVRAGSKGQGEKHDQKFNNIFDKKIVSASKVQYGKMETKRAIQNVLDTVINHYKYSSSAELNAVLKQYNVVADRGTENSIVYKKKGLYYRALDGGGNKIGVPIKASLFHQKPTLNYLQKRFELNESLKPPLKQHVKVAIDWVVHRNAHTLHSLEEALKKEGIQTVIRKNEEGFVYGMTYIDHKNKVVFNGSDLGKEYSAKGLIERMTEKNLKGQEVPLLLRPKLSNSLLSKKGDKQDLAGEKEKNLSLEKAIEIVLDPTKENNFFTLSFVEEKKKEEKISSSSKYFLSRHPKRSKIISIM